MRVKLHNAHLMLHTALCVCYYCTSQLYQAEKDYEAGRIPATICYKRLYLMPNISFIDYENTEKADRDMYRRFPLEESNIVLSGESGDIV